MNQRNTLLLLLAAMGSAALPASAQTTAPSTVAVKTLPASYMVTGAAANGWNYGATIASDGSMTSFTVLGVEMLDAAIGGSRGAYIQQKGYVPANQIEVTADKAVVAQSDKAELRYQFTNSGVHIVLKNKSDSPMRYRLIPEVHAKHVIDDNGKAFILPSDAKQVFAPAGYVLSREHVAMHFAGAGQNGGRFEHNRAMIDFPVQPGETTQFDIDLTRPTPEQRTKIAAAEAAAVKVSEIEVVSPMDYQVFQRQTKSFGHLRIGGQLHVDADTVEAKFSDDAKVAASNDDEQTKAPTLSSKQWQRIGFDPSTKSFHEVIDAKAGGWYKLELRAMKGGQQVATTTIDHVGIGEVFIGAGQSNSTNSGDGGLLKTETGLVSAFSGTNWRLSEDPQPGTHDDSYLGSFWPAFGDAMVAKYHVPVGVAVTGHGGTSINQWHAGDDLFNWTLLRMGQFGPGGFRALLWHQGENDCDMSSEEYRDGLANVIRDFKKQAGWDFPFFVARVSYRNPENPSFDTTRNGQKALWDSGIALEGPDTDTLTGDMRDKEGKGIHFSKAGRIAHGKMWADKVGVYLDKWLESK